MKKKMPQAAVILIAMVAGVILGYMVFVGYPDKKGAAEIAGYISIFSDVFLRLIKMLIGPLVFSTLVVGIAHLGDAASIGRVFVKGARLVHHGFARLPRARDDPRQPAAARPQPRPSAPGDRIAGQPGDLQVHGEGVHQPPGAEVVRRIDGQQRDPPDRGVLDVLRRGGRVPGREGAHAGGGDRRARPRDAQDHRLRDEDGAGGRVRGDGGDRGRQRPEILLRFAVFMGDFYLALFVLWGRAHPRGFVVLGPRLFRLLVLIKEAFFISFATASSEAAYPKILDALDRFGVKRKISSFVLPLGYSFNLDGSMMYCTFATLFIARPTASSSRSARRSRCC
jgi:hypothetical protein